MKNTLYRKFLMVMMVLPVASLTAGEGVSFEDESATWAPVNPKSILETVAETPDNTQLKLPSDANPNQVEAALRQLDAQLKPKANRRDELQVNPRFQRELNAKQQRGLNKVAEGYGKKVREGKIKPVQLPNGNWRIDPGEGKTEGRGRGRTWGGEDESSLSDVPEGWHRTGDGSWSWRLTYHWWGVKLSLNHNFLNYLCYYTTWMLDRSGLPGWLKTILRVVACAPHNLDRSADGIGGFLAFEIDVDGLSIPASKEVLTWINRKPFAYLLAANHRQHRGVAPPPGIGRSLGPLVLCCLILRRA